MEEEKLVTGETSTLGFIRIMKSKGVNVSPVFPAESLRSQIDSLNERHITFQSPNEVVVSAVNEGGSAVSVTKTFVAVGVEESDAPYITFLDRRNGIVGRADLPAELTYPEGTVVDITPFCDGYYGYTGTYVFGSTTASEYSIDYYEDGSEYVSYNLDVSGLTDEDRPTAEITLADGRFYVVDLPCELSVPVRQDVSVVAKCVGYYDIYTSIFAEEVGEGTTLSFAKAPAEITINFWVLNELPSGLTPIMSYKIDGGERGTVSLPAELTFPYGTKLTVSVAAGDYRNYAEETVVYEYSTDKYFYLDIYKSVNINLNGGFDTYTGKSMYSVSYTEESKPVGDNAMYFRANIGDVTPPAGKAFQCFTSVKDDLSTKIDCFDSDLYPTVYVYWQDAGYMDITVSVSNLEQGEVASCDYNLYGPITYPSVNYSLPATISVPVGSTTDYHIYCDGYYDTWCEFIAIDPNVTTLNVELSKITELRYDLNGGTYGDEDYYITTTSAGDEVDVYQIMADRIDDWDLPVIPPEGKMLDHCEDLEGNVVTDYVVQPGVNDFVVIWKDAENVTMNFYAEYDYDYYDEGGSENPPPRPQGTPVLHYEYRGEHYSVDMNNAMCSITLPYGSTIYGAYVVWDNWEVFSPRNITFTEDGSDFTFWLDAVGYININLNGGDFNGASVYSIKGRYERVYTTLTLLQEMNLESITPPSDKAFKGLTLVQDDESTLTDSFVCGLVGDLYVLWQDNDVDSVVSVSISGADGVTGYCDYHFQIWGGGYSEGSVDVVGGAEPVRLYLPLGAVLRLDVYCDDYVPIHNVRNFVLVDQSYSVNVALQPAATIVYDLDGGETEDGSEYLIINNVYPGEYDEDFDMLISEYFYEYFDQGYIIPPEGKMFYRIINNRTGQPISASGTLYPGANDFTIEWKDIPTSLTLNFQLDNWDTFGHWEGEEDDEHFVYDVQPTLTYYWDDEEPVTVNFEEGGGVTLTNIPTNVDFYYTGSCPGYVDVVDSIYTSYSQYNGRPIYFYIDEPVGE